MTEISSQALLNQLSDYEGFYVHQDSKVGLFAIIALHSTRRGPAIGGCRCVAYETITHAAQDALKLGKAMSLKSAFSELPTGGGKAVIMHPGHIEDREAFFKSFAQFVNQLEGRYYTSVDSGTTQEDLDIIAKYTPYIAADVPPNTPIEKTASWLTAETVFYALQAVLEHTLKKDTFNQVHIAIQGVGKVGGVLAKHLLDCGAQLTISDINTTLTDQIHNLAPDRVTVVDNDQILTTSCDILAPCALGGVIHTNNVDTLNTKAVCGAANNPLESQTIADRLKARGIDYVPDFVANAGGVILASMKLNNHKPSQWSEKATEIQARTKEILTIANERNISPLTVANELAEQRLYQAN